MHWHFIDNHFCCDFRINGIFGMKTGMYFESCHAGVCVERVTNEFALAILYEVVWPQNRDRLFEAFSDSSPCAMMRFRLATGAS